MQKVYMFCFLFCSAQGMHEELVDIPLTRYMATHSTFGMARDFLLRLHNRDVLSYIQCLKRYGSVRSYLQHKDDERGVTGNYDSVNQDVYFIPLLMHLERVILDHEATLTVHNISYKEHYYIRLQMPQDCPVESVDSIANDTALVREVRIRDIDALVRDYTGVKRRTINP